MKRSLLVLFAALLTLGALPAHVGAADSCGAATMLTDPQGDWDSSITGGGVGTDWEDLLSVSVTPVGGDKLQFTIKVVSLPAVLPPDAAWFVSFYGPDENTVYGVRMQTDNTTLPTFLSYVAAPANGGQVDGRFMGATKDADPASNFNADGTINIIVPAGDIGLSAGGSLSGFDAATIQGVGAGGPDVLGLDVDDAPAALARDDGVFHYTCDNKSGLLGLGAMPLAGLLLLAGFAALRRRVA